MYDEMMGVPLIVKAPSATAGSRTRALATHVDLAATIAALGGVSPADTPTLSGRDLSPVPADPSASVRDFDDHDHEWHETVQDPHELVNLANDRGGRNGLRALFRRLLDYEDKELTQTP